MTLADYRRKRDFARTPEPHPGSAPTTETMQFVVHRHEARNLHYDLRLQHGDALCSWAVPKGFSFDPDEKRLAVRTEDHPMEYLEFEGVIPKGEYGAGTMRVWDRGTFQLVVEPDWDAAVTKGEIKVVLDGRKLRGEWHLVKTKQAENTWLLFKSRDLYSGSSRDTALGVSLDAAPRAAMADAVELMRVTGERAPFSDPYFLFEMRFEGRRLLAEKKGDSVQLRGLPDIPTVNDGIARLAARDALVDGVLVALDDEDRPDCELLARRLREGEFEGVQYYAFDLLHYDDFDLRPLPLIDRKSALRAVFPQHRALLFVDHVAGKGEELAESIRITGLPGVIAKRADASYGDPGSWVAVPVEVDLARPREAVGEALSRRRGRLPGESRRVKVSNIHKVYWQAEGYTKGDLLAYYDRVADDLLPHLMDRPVHMLRYPDGIDGKSFYQRRAPEHLPEWFATELIQGRESEHLHMVCVNRDSVLYLVNLGSIDLHPWMSRVGSLDSPDYAVIDLDPKSAPFSDVVKVARVVGRILRGIGLEPYLKTSGKTGLHILIPLQSGYTYEQSVMFCEGVARAVCREASEIATVERNVANRGGRVYVDFLQNRRGQTIPPPYVVRPVQGATVSTPLAWDELASDLSPGQFTIQTVPDRLARLGDLCRGVLTNRQDLMPAITALADYMKG